MSTTTNFEEWLEDNDPDGYEDVFAVYKAAHDRCDWGHWTVTTKGVKTFIKGPAGTLSLLSEKARIAFMATVARSVGESVATMEGWYYFQYAMTKPD